MATYLKTSDSVLSASKKCLHGFLLYIENVMQMYVPIQPVIDFLTYIYKLSALNNRSVVIFSFVLTNDISAMYLYLNRSWKSFERKPGPRDSNSMAAPSSLHQRGKIGGISVSVQWWLQGPRYFWTQPMCMHIGTHH